VHRRVRRNHNSTFKAMRLRLSRALPITKEARKPIAIIKLCGWALKNLNLVALYDDAAELARRIGAGVDIDPIGPYID
jgi:hypothetical protein